jgi:predicted glycosyltransferase
MRLMMYSQDGMGLGHLRRTRNIAREVLELQPDAHILAVADAPDAPFFPRLDRMEFVKLPTIVKTGPGAWRAHTARTNETVALRGQLILDAYKEFSPDAVLVDHMPAGARGELMPLLDNALASRERPRLILGLRDILDEPSTVERAWREDGALDYLGEYDRVLVHGAPDVYDAAEQYGLCQRTRRLTYNHYVAPRRPHRTTAAASTDPFVLMTGGGGADAYRLARAFVGAVSILRRSRTLRSLVLAGPNMPSDEQASLMTAAAAAGVEVRTSMSDATKALRRASALVTMGGYNTLCEALAWRKRALVVPRSGPSAEQRMRSRIFAERGLVRLIEPEELSPERLADSLDGLLDEPVTLPDDVPVPPLDGARRAARLIVQLVPAAAGTR